MSAPTLAELRRENEGPPLRTPRLLSRHAAAKHRVPWPHSALASVMTDFLLVCASGWLAYELRFSSELFYHLHFLESPVGQLDGLSSVHVGFVFLYVAMLLLVAHWQTLYRYSPERSAFTESGHVVRAVAVATVLLTAFIYLAGTKTVSRLVVGFTAVFSASGLIGWRVYRSYLRRKQLEQGRGCQHALIIGAGKIGQRFAAYLEENPNFGYKVKGFLDSNHRDDPRILGKTEDLTQVARREFIDDIFVTIPSERELVKRITLEAGALSLGVKVIPELYDGLGWLPSVEFIGDFPVSILRNPPIPAFRLLLKRVLDIVGSVIGLILLSPVFLLIALAIKLDSPGPILYRGRRVGHKGRQFDCYKFRTMVLGADKQKKELAHLNERVGPLFKITRDPRVTRLGTFLRKYSLDELAQLWNVLKGDMSLVGPRPPDLEEINDYQPEQLRRLEVTPGVTGLWQVSARHDPFFETAVALDNYYIENWSLQLDFEILLKTIPVVWRGLGR
jgi:exopolysaccharide biosynthesis polyprenyl glycosylphosphotransferase